MAAADEVRAMLATSDDVFTAGAVSGPCFFWTYDDEVQTDAFGGSKQLVRRADAQVCADDFPALGQDDTVSVNGTSYTVFGTRLIQDGHSLMVNLKLVRG